MTKVDEILPLTLSIRDTSFPAVSSGEKCPPNARSVGSVGITSPNSACHRCDMLDRKRRRSEKGEEEMRERQRKKVANNTQLLRLLEKFLRQKVLLKVFGTLVIAARAPCRAMKSHASRLSPSSWRNC